VSVNEYVAGAGWAFSFLARKLGHHVKNGMLQKELKTLSKRNLSEKEWIPVLSFLAAQMGFDITLRRGGDIAKKDLPVCVYIPDLGWGVIKAQSLDGSWLVDVSKSGSVTEKKVVDISAIIVAVLRYVKTSSTQRNSFFSFARNLFISKGKSIRDAAIATTFVNVLSIVVSFYSMQIYDRVIPLAGISTLTVLTVGAVLVLIFDFIIKKARSHALEMSLVDVDKEISRSLFSKIMRIRLDQFPRSVGTFSSQVRSYESVRLFLSSSTLYFLVDLPFSLIFITFIALIGGFEMAAIPCVFILISLLIGLVLKQKITKVTAESVRVSNQKMGLLVEAVEGAETIKASGADWWVKKRWDEVLDAGAELDVRLKSLNESLGYVVYFSYQASYIFTVAIGAYLAIRGELTTGALVACSIISGRALNSIATLPNLTVQWGNAKAALESLERIWKLKDDHDELTRPLVPGDVKGGMGLWGVQYSYDPKKIVLSIKTLDILPGERVGVMGPVGGGKSTLLKILAGLYRPQLGSVYLDGVDMALVARPFLSENIGYLQQDVKLFQGTLRDNLVLGFPDPGDAKILEVSQATGLCDLIRAHPKGLDLPIGEGGNGVSGGERQLIGFTRILLANPRILLLDEPTAAMDERTELRCISALANSLTPSHTLIIVTHKPLIATLVSRLLIVRGEVAVDGPKEAVLAHLQELASKSISQKQSTEG